MSETHEQRARALSVMLAEILGGGSEWFSRVGDEFYIDPKLAGAELRRRKTDAQITKRLLFQSKTGRADHG